MTNINLNLNGVKKSQKNDNNVPDYLKNDNSVQQSSSIFDTTVLGELEKQNKKLDNALNKPAFEMTKAEKQETKKLNNEQAKRTNYQKASEARQKVIKNYAEYINKYKIDVNGKTADQIEQAILEEVIKENEAKSQQEAISGSVSMHKCSEFGVYEGRIAGKDFSVKRSSGKGYYYEGSVGGKSVNVKETNDFFSNDGTFTGTIGDKKLTMKSKTVSYNRGTEEFSGVYDGKSFTVKYDDNGRTKECERTLYGKFGNEDVDIKSKNNTTFDNNKIPKDFEDVVSLIFVRGNYINDSNIDD